MKARFIIIMVLCFVLAAAFAQAGELSPFKPSGTSTFMIKPVKSNYTVGENVKLHLYLMSTDKVNFTANITLVQGTSTLNNFDVVDTTGEALEGTCIGSVCDYNGLWPFTINSLPITYQVVLTDRNTGDTYTTNITTPVDKDSDGYIDINTGGTDCNDANPNIKPGAADNTADGIDNDCDGSTDEDYVAPSGGSSSTSGGGSHRGGRTSGALTTANFDCMKGNVTVGKNDKIVVSYKKTNYTFFINDILASTMQVKLYPIPSRDYAIDEGKGKEIDLDRNNRNDFILNVLDIKNGKASITCRTTSEIGATVEPKKEEPKEEEEETPVMQNIKEGVINIASQVIPKEKASPVIGSLVALAIIVGGLLIYYLTRRGEADEVAY